MPRIKILHWSVYILLWISITSLVLQMFVFYKTPITSNIGQYGQTFEGISYREISSLPNQDSEWRRKATIFNVKSLPKRFLTIGIPTVRRDQSNYFFATLDSLINCTSSKQLQEIFVVIFLADFNSTWKFQTADKINKKYPILVRDGTMQIIQAPKEFYPPLDNLTHTYNDGEARSKWRSKQNVDYAFIWLYSMNLSKYYMQMEDDIFTEPGYIDSIQKFILDQKTDWTCLEFSELGFIGKVYHSKYLERLAKTVLLFYQEHPVDYIFLYFNILNLQNKRIIRRPTLFQHTGFHSSLSGKIQPLKDKFFDDFKKTIKGHNPPAKLYTTLKVSPDFPLEMAYSGEDGYFWAHSAPLIGDTIHVVFNEPQNVNKVVITSGSKWHPTDKMENARLDACLSVRILQENNIECFNTVVLGFSENGTITAGNLEKQLNNFVISGLRITFTKGQQWWLILKEIAIFTNKT